MGRNLRRFMTVLTIALAGCVDGSPVDPTVCTIQADSLVVEIEWSMLANCPSVGYVWSMPR